MDTPIHPAVFVDVVDFTLDDDSPMEDAPILVNNSPKPKEEPTFFSTLVHRRPSATLSQPPLIPQKRKSAESTDDSARQSRKPTPLNNSFHAPADSTEASVQQSQKPTSIIKSPHTPTTPSPAPNSHPSDNVEVVIFSPPEQRQALIKKGKPRVKCSSESIEEFLDAFFLVDAQEKAKAARRRYPTRRTVDRKAIPFTVQSQPLKWTSVTANQFLRIMQQEKFNRNHGAKLSFDIDDEKLAMLSSNFGFVNEYKLQDGVTPAPDDFVAGCECEGPCDPWCDCLNEELNSNKKIVPYQEVNGRMVLRRDFMKRKSIISECSSKCSCNGDCWNHVVQDRRSVRLQIFDTGERGFGLRTLDPIINGQFVDLYLGEVITKKEADRREAVNEQGQSYLFSLDWYDEVNDDDIYVVDGQKFGSPTRFMNHSCNSNCKIIPVTTTSSADRRLYYLAFFATRDIPAGTELTFDYNPGWNGSKEFDPKAVPCLCGELKCRGQLWPNKRKQG